MNYGDWTENSRGSYNKWDAICHCTTRVRNFHAKMKKGDMVGLDYFYSEVFYAL